MTAVASAGYLEAGCAELCGCELCCLQSSLFPRVSGPSRLPRARRLFFFEHLAQALKEHHLCGVDPAARFGEGEPLGAVDLGELAHRARARWPLEREGVAPHAGRVEVAFRGPGAHELAAGLSGAAELTGRVGRRRDAKLLLKLAQGAGTRVLALLVL